MSDDGGGSEHGVDGGEKGAEPTPERPPYALTIASSDSGGGAGIQADLKTMTRLGVYGGSVCVALTAQNSHSVDSVHTLPTEEVRAQFEAVTEDFDVRAVKVGMLATESIVRTVTELLDDFDGQVVVDPVMVSSAGDTLLDPAAVDAYDALFERATLVTPNADEAEAVTGVRPDSAASVRDAAAGFRERGADATLLKGGHVDTDDTVRDTLVTGDDEAVFESDRVATDSTHGSGCTLASAIAARLAHGDDLQAAVERGLAFTHATIASPADVGERGSVNHLVDAEGALPGIDVG
ncbi:bifunctional hydroxymethylpyrimidine kinase/phosphomethylpyrimidine kinase [Halomarina salina]|uniref:Bifunctional hydroxymethylpyrimidine kinase/phosphomethylpyrimidine kinase n=1 Tax=Halomarina salina TaxID=1872699 RepID=A0ABD5RNH8_9EURY|nr:bifunctional hydroxymethylpyrimidine kinase/phosphomethylpyrimidine kinase [Halomarina salina]